MLKNWRKIHSAVLMMLKILRFSQSLEQGVEALVHGMLSLDKNNYLNVCNTLHMETTTAL